jgi:hypothetical protein
VQSGVQSIVTSRPVPQQTAQIVSPLAGQKRVPLRFSQIGQTTDAPSGSKNRKNTPRERKRQKAG